MSVPPVPSEPYANKAIVSALGTVVLVLLRWATSGEFQYTDEGLITLAGAITSLAVYAVSNYRRVLGLKDERGLTTVEVLLIAIAIGVAVLLVVIL